MRISDWSSDVCSSDLDVLAELRERQLDRVRAGREDHVAALELDGAAVVLLHRHDVAGLQLAEAVVRGALVGLEQRRAAAGELLHALVLAGHHRADVDLRVLGADPVLAAAVAEVPELARELGRASCRESVCQYGYISLVCD